MFISRDRLHVMSENYENIPKISILNLQTLLSFVLKHITGFTVDHGCGLSAYWP